MLFHESFRAFRAAIVLFVAFATLARVPAGGDTPAPATEEAPLPSKADVLAAIERFEKNTMDAEAMGKDVATIIYFVEKSPDVLVTLGKMTTPWAFSVLEKPADGVEKPAAGVEPNVVLLVITASYYAGNIQTQLKSGKPVDDPYSGWLFAIRTYRLLQSGWKDKVDFPYLDQLDKLEARGWLKEYAGYITQENLAAKQQKTQSPDTATARPPALTRNDLNAAHQLRTERKYAEACKAYAAWLEQNPDDADTHASLAYTLTLRAGAETNKKRSSEHMRAARPHVLKAHALGSNDPLLPELLETTAPGYDSSKHRYSDSKKAHEQIELAEKAFARHRYEDALKYYQQALRHDPKSYTATLFSGDCYYTMGKHSQAIEWFGKAVALNPDIETAHRYMADALRKSGRHDEAFAKYIDALIAEPYAKLPRSMLQKVASARNPLFKPSPLTRVPLVPVVVTDDKKIELGIPPANQNKMILAYAVARAGWRVEKGPAHFSKGVTPRHCAAEEMEGLRALAEVVLLDNENKSAEASDWLPVAAEVDRLDKAGLLEAAIYLDRATKEIAGDYPAYRAAHRDLLARYLRETWYGEN